MKEWNGAIDCPMALHKNCRIFRSQVAQCRSDVDKSHFAKRGCAPLFFLRTEDTSLRIAVCGRPIGKQENAMFDRVCVQRRVVRVYRCDMEPTIQNTRSEAESASRICASTAVNAKLALDRCQTMSTTHIPGGGLQLRACRNLCFATWNVPAQETTRRI